MLRPDRPLITSSQESDQNVYLDASGQVADNKDSSTLASPIAAADTPPAAPTANAARRPSVEEIDYRASMKQLEADLKRAETRVLVMNIVAIVIAIIAVVALWRMTHGQTT